MELQRTARRMVPAYTGICRYVWLLCGYNHKTARRTGTYRYVRCTAYKVAPDGGLTEPETCRASNGK
jgi:hypothetical protein